MGYFKPGNRPRMAAILSDLCGPKKETEAQCAMIRALRRDDIEYLLSTTPALRLFTSAENELHSHKDMGDFALAQRVTLILLSRVGFPAREPSRAAKALLERQIDTDPVFFTQPLASGITPFCYLAATTDARETGLLKRLLGQLIARQAEAEEKAAAASQSRLLDSTCSAENTLPDFNLMQTILWREEDTVRSFFALVSDAVLSAVITDDVLMKALKIHNSSSLVLFERMAKSGLLTENVFMSALRLARFSNSNKVLMADYFDKLLNILSCSTVSPFRLVAWIERNLSDSDDYGVKCIYYLRDTVRAIKKPKEVMKETPNIFIDFATRHLVELKTTLDLDKWVTLLTQAMTALDNRETWYKAILSMLLVHALLRSDKVRAYQRICQMEDTRSLSAEDCFLMGSTLIESVKKLDEDVQRLFALVPLDIHAITLKGLSHLKAAAEKGGQGAQMMRQSFIESLPEVREFEAQDQRDLENRKLGALLKCSTKLNELRWADLSGMMRKITSPAIMKELARYKLEFEKSIANPDTALLIVRGMQAFVIGLIAQLSSAAEHAAAKKAEEQQSTFAAVRGFFARAEQPSPELQALKEIETCLQQVSSTLSFRPQQYASPAAASGVS